jgi:hypothetical protein
MKAAGEGRRECSVCVRAAHSGCAVVGLNLTLGSVPGSAGGNYPGTPSNSRIRSRAPREQLTADFDLDVAVEDENDRELLDGPRRQALERALGDLPERHRELMQALLADPVPSYAEIASRLGVPIGSIGPIRARCLTRLRKQSALREFSDFGD